MWTESKHSLLLTECTELYRVGITEKVIVERSGYSSLTGLRQNEFTSSKQDSKTLGSKSAKNLLAAASTQCQINQHSSHNSQFTIDQSSTCYKGDFHMYCTHNEHILFCNHSSLLICPLTSVSVSHLLGMLCAHLFPCIYAE